MERDKGSVRINKTKAAPRRLGLIRLCPEVLLTLLKEPRLLHMKFEGIPSDATLVDFFRDESCYTMVVESEQLAEVRAGGSVPVIDAVINYAPVPAPPRPLPPLYPEQTALVS